MYKRILAALLCTVMTAAAVTSCGNNNESDSKSESSSSEDAGTVSGDKETETAPAEEKENETSPISQAATEAPVTDGTINLSRFADRSVPDLDLENASIKNFTAPEVGEDIIIMKFKGYEGEVKIRLFPEYAELGVQNFIGLADKGYYDGLTMHRIMADFMIQGGDPNGTGTGGESVWGGDFDGGTSDKLTHAAGTIAYANSGATSTNGSQFYIVTGETYNDDYLAMLEANGYSFSDDVKKVLAAAGGAPWLDGGYTVFGQVYEGLDIVFAIQDVEVYQSNAFSTEVSTPVQPVVLEYVKTGKYEGEELKWFIADYMDGASDTEKKTEASD